VPFLRAMSKMNTAFQESFHGNDRHTQTPFFALFLRLVHPACNRMLQGVFPTAARTDRSEDVSDFALLIERSVVYHELCKKGRAN